MILVSDQSTTLKFFSSTWKLIKCTSKLTPVCIQIWLANEPELWRTFNHRFISEIMTQDYLNFIKVNIVDFRSSTSLMCIVFVLCLVLRCMIKEKQLLLLRDIQIYFNIVKRVVTVFRHIDSLSRRAQYMDM